MWRFASQFAPVLLTAMLAAYSCFLGEDQRLPNPETNHTPTTPTHGVAEDTSQSRDPFDLPAEPVIPTSIGVAPFREPSGPADTAPIDSLQQFVEQRTLVGTFVSGERRLAVIDGKIYKEGMRLNTDGAEIFVAQIGDDQVILRKGDEEKILSYKRAKIMAESPKKQSDSNQPTGGTPHD